MDGDTLDRARLECQGFVDCAMEIGMPQFIYVIRPVRADMLTAGPTADEQAAIAAHFAYLKMGVADGVVHLAGRTDTTGPETFGLCIFETTDRAAATAFTLADPAVAAGIFKAETLPFRTAVQKS